MCEIDHPSFIYFWILEYVSLSRDMSGKTNDVIIKVEDLENILFW